MSLERPQGQVKEGLEMVIRSGDSGRLGAVGFFRSGFRHLVWWCALHLCPCPSCPLLEAALDVLCPQSPTRLPTSGLSLQPPRPAGLALIKLLLLAGLGGSVTPVGLPKLCPHVYRQTRLPL